MPKNGGCCSKNVYKISIEGGKERRKTEIIQGLLIEFSFDFLLKIVEIARSPNLEKVKTMLEEAFTEKYQSLQRPSLITSTRFLSSIFRE